MKRLILLCGLVLSGCSESPQPFSAICPVTGKPAKENIYLLMDVVGAAEDAAPVRKKKVHFCCKQCKEKFAEDLAKEPTP